MIPSTRLITPYTDPENTFPATDVREMYSLASEHTRLDFTYQLGIAPVGVEQHYALRNDTMNVTLRFHIELPAYVTMNLPTEFTLKPDDSVSFLMVLNENDARKKAITGTKLFHDVVKMTVTPINVTGPVYVRNNLPPLTL